MTCLSGAQNKNKKEGPNNATKLSAKDNVRGTNLTGTHNWIRPYQDLYISDFQYISNPSAGTRTKDNLTLVPKGKNK